MLGGCTVKCVKTGTLQRFAAGGVARDHEQMLVELAIGWLLGVAVQQLF